jgi:hypothetical protein
VLGRLRAGGGFWRRCLERYALEEQLPACARACAPPPSRAVGEVAPYDEESARQVRAWWFGTRLRSARRLATGADPGFAKTRTSRASSVAARQSSAPR